MRFKAVNLLGVVHKRLTQDAFPCLIDTFSALLQYLASLGIQALVQQGATQGKVAHKLMDALKDTDILHWKHSLSELIEISLAQSTSIWRMYGKRSDARSHVSARTCTYSIHIISKCGILVLCSTMALQQAQLLLHMSSLEPVNFGVHQNNTEAFAVVLCHLAELHAEQVKWPI